MRPSSSHPRSSVPPTRLNGSASTDRSRPAPSAARGLRRVRAHATRRIDSTHRNHLNRYAQSGGAGRFSSIKFRHVGEYIIRASIGAAAIAAAALGFAPTAGAQPPYANCTAAHTDGRYDIPVGDPAYWDGGGRDDDGIACES